MDFSLFKQYEPLYIICHKHPDIDTIVSALLLKNIFKSKGIESFACFLDKDYEIDEQNKKMLDDCTSFEMTILNEKELDNKNFILVDHNDPIQSIGLNKRILWGIDHHPNEGVLSNIYIKLYGSCALLIYDYFKNNYVFSNEEKYMIYMATLENTCFMKKKNISDKSKELIFELGFNFNNEEMFNRYFILTDLDKSLDYYIDNPNKFYDYKGVEFSSINIKTIDDYDYLRKDFINKIDALDKNFLGVWFNYTKEVTYCYFKYKDNEVYEIIYDFIAGRGSDIIPDVYKYIDKVLNEK